MHEILQTLGPPIFGYIWIGLWILLVVFNTVLFYAYEKLQSMVHRGNSIEIECYQNKNLFNDCSWDSDRITYKISIGNNKYDE